MDKQHLVGLIMMAVGCVEVVLLSLIGLLKQRFILIVAGVLGGLITGGLGLAIYLGKIVLGG